MRIHSSEHKLSTTNLGKSNTTNMLTVVLLIQLVAIAFCTLSPSILTPHLVSDRLPSTRILPRQVIGVKKTIIIAGISNGTFARPGDNITVHYTGWLYNASQPEYKGTQYVMSQR